MGTRSLVAVMHGEVVKSVYCHYDGYLSYTGEILQKHYNSTEANLLVSLGYNSGVKETVEEMNFYKDREQEGEDVNKLLDSTPWQVAHTFEQFLDQVSACGAEYYYIMKDNVWYAGCVYETQGLIKDGLVELSQALESIAAVESE